MMNKQELIESICYIPMNFWTDVSTKQINDWFEKQKRNKKLCKDIEVNQLDICDYLKKKNEIIESWYVYSTDRRGGNYYFDKRDSEYISGRVSGFFRKAKIFVQSKKPEEACANFIMNELDLR